jgi:integrase
VAKRRRRGHIRQRGPTSFLAVAYAGVDPMTKKQRYLTETARTYDDAEKALTWLLAQVDQQRSPATGATVASLIARWLEVADLELTTRDGYEGYKGYIRRNIPPVLGDMPLRRLNAETLDRFYAHLRAHGGRCTRCWDRARRGLPPLRAGERYQPKSNAPEVVHEPDCARGLPLAPSSVRQIHAIMRRALAQGVKWGWLPTNPAALASRPRLFHATCNRPAPRKWPSSSTLLGIVIRNSGRCSGLR